MADQTTVLSQIQSLFTVGRISAATLLTALGLLAGYTANQTNNLGGALTGNLPSPSIANGAITPAMMAPSVSCFAPPTANFKVVNGVVTSC